MSEKRGAAHVDRIEGQSAAETAELRGNVDRLLCLAYRFSLRLARSTHHLEQARGHFDQACSIVGLADIATNAVEVLALTDPTRALSLAPEALRQQQDLAADHEIGKIHSAVGLAYVTLGQFAAAETALDQACAALERSGYRSGRARAELYRAFLHLRRDEPARAVDCARWAVGELEAAEVYPTLVLLAARALARAGRPDPQLEAAAARATDQIEVAGGVTALDRRITDLLTRLLDDDAMVLYDTARADNAPLSGFYHHNVRVGDRLVRIPIPGAATMDLALWPEPMVLGAIGSHLAAVPRLHAAVVEPAFQIHEYVTGNVLDAVAPRGVELPVGVIDRLAAFFADLGRVPLDELPMLPADWPADGDCASFAARMSAVTAQVVAENAPGYRWLWQLLDYPTDPLAGIDWSSLADRPFRILHADVHRKNLIVSGSGPGLRCTILDWELALWGDPVYDLATHLHKMGYTLAEEQHLTAAWVDAWEQTAGHAAIEGWHADLATYRRHEHIKSSLVDSVRYHRLVHDPSTPPDRVPGLIRSLTDKVRNARDAWGIPIQVTDDHICAILNTEAPTAGEPRTTMSSE